MVSLGEKVRAFQLHDGVGPRRRCTRCGGIQLGKDADILVAESLEATTEDCHHGIGQLGGHSLPHRRRNLIGGCKAGALQRQLLVAEAVSMRVDAFVGLINWFKSAKAGEEGQSWADMV